MTLPSFTREQVLDLLVPLVETNSINPMDGAFTGVRPVEAACNDLIEDWFADVDLKVERDPFSTQHENLYVRIPGREEGPAILFESHVDTVPADDWADTALHARVDGDRLYGRGSADTKASTVAMMLAVADLARRGEQPRRPVLFMAAGDEEFAQTGIKHFRSLPEDIGFGVFGEPSGLEPIVQHKGTVRWDVTVHGRAAHSSRPHNGINAIHGAVDVLAGMQRHQDAKAEVHDNPLMTPATITVTMINGGRTRNAVPDECTLAIDYRVVPGDDPADVRQALIDALGELPHTISHGEPQLITPPLSTRMDDPFVHRVVDACARNGGVGEPRAVPYGTDASWISDRAPAVVLGPGSIDVAHAIDEWVPISEVMACAAIYRDLMLDPLGGAR